MNSKLIAITFIGFIVSINAYAKDEWHYLIDKNLTQFERWVGVPHTSLERLPADFPRSADVTKGTPLGLNNDPLNIFSVIEEDGELLIKITGEIYGGINTKKSYKNYHLKLQFRWGFPRYEPRLTKKRDSGLLYHCQSEHGAFWNTWKACLEYQIQESDIGDYIGLGPRGQYRGFTVDEQEKPDKRDQGSIYYDPKSNNIITGSGYTNALIENDAAFGNWNTVELYAVGDESAHVINGELVFFIENLQSKNGDSLRAGQLQFQSEGAEIFYKSMAIRNIDKFPDFIEQQVRRIEQ